MARPRSKVAAVVVEGPLAPFASAYKSRLRELGYTPLTIVKELRQVSHLSCWLAHGGMTAADLGVEQVEAFLAERAGGGHGACSAAGLTPLLEVVRAAGVALRDPGAVDWSAAEALLASFRHHLLAERGLAGGTTDAYVAYARRFLAELGTDGGLSAVSSAEVTRAVQREAARVTAASAQYFVAGLRSFLQFCFLEGLASADLSAAALAVTGRRRSSLPRGISHAHATALLRSCDRRWPGGRRDYAILLVLLRLGLRAGEAAALTLDDIDWRSGELVVRGKGRREDRMPLLVDVGEAIVAYLQRGRPTHPTRRELFIRMLAPIGPLGRGGVSCVVRRACRRAGVPEVGAHRLRHTLACEMVAAGVELPEISHVLRHRGISSTSIYARVDLDALRELALPWPGGEPR